MTGAEKPPYEKPEATPLGGDGPLSDEDIDGVAGGVDCGIGGYPHGLCVGGEWADSCGVGGRIVPP